jgi:hypothetical protein
MRRYMRLSGIAGREKTMTVRQPRHRRRKVLDAGPFQPEIGSFRLRLAAEGKAVKTVRTYTEAVQWFAAVHLIRRTACTRWDQVQGHDVQRWMVWLLGLHPPTVTEKLVAVTVRIGHQTRAWFNGPWRWRGRAWSGRSGFRRRRG